MAHILLIDDEVALTKVLRPALAAEGYDVTTAHSAAEGIRRAHDLAPDLVLLDLGLPDADGKEVLAALRLKHDMPVIVVSARHQQDEKVAALDAGADDYVDKPFEIGELMARVRAGLRRHRTSDTPSGFRAGGLEIDFATRSVSLQGEEVKLSPKEYDLLVALARSAGRVVTHKRLITIGWPSRGGDMQYLRTYMGLLRQKIEANPGAPKFILTEPGVGYRLVPSDA